MIHARFAFATYRVSLAPAFRPMILAASARQSFQTASRRPTGCSAVLNGKGKPLKRQLDGACVSTGLKPSVNERSAFVKSYQIRDNSCNSCLKSNRG